MEHDRGCVLGEPTAEDLRALANAGDDIPALEALAAAQRLRGRVLERLAELEPHVARRHLDLHRHWALRGDEERAAGALDRAEALSPADVEVARCRLAAATDLTPAEIAAVAERYRRSFPDEPVFELVHARCEAALRAGRPERDPLLVPSPSRRQLAAEIARLPVRRAGARP